MGPCHHLLIRRSLAPNEKGIRDVAFYLCFVPEGRPVTLRSLIKVAGCRWPVEEDFQVVTEVKRLINLATRAWHSLEHHLRWHIWRRRHQARARWFHQRTRLARR